MQRLYDCSLIDLASYRLDATRNNREDPEMSA